MKRLLFSMMLGLGSVVVITSCAVSKSPQEIVGEIVRHDFSSAILSKFSTELDRQIIPESQFSHSEKYLDWMYSLTTIVFEQVQVDQDKAILRVSVQKPNIGEIFDKELINTHDILNKHRKNKDKEAHPDNIDFVSADLEIDELVMKIYPDSSVSAQKTNYTLNFIRRNDGWQLFLNLSEIMARQKLHDLSLKNEILKNLIVTSQALNQEYGVVLDFTVQNRTKYDLSEFNEIQFEIAYLDDSDMIVSDQVLKGYTSELKADRVEDFSFLNGVNPPSTWKSGKFRISVKDLDIPFELQTATFQNVLNISLEKRV